MGTVYSVSVEGTVTRAGTHQVGSHNISSSSRNTAGEGQVRDGREEMHVRQRADVPQCVLYPRDCLL